MALVKKRLAARGTNASPKTKRTKRHKDTKAKSRQRIIRCNTPYSVCDWGPIGRKARPRSKVKSQCQKPMPNWSQTDYCMARLGRDRKRCDKRTRGQEDKRTTCVATGTVNITVRPVDTSPCKMENTFQRNKNGQFEQADERRHAL
jgi:hypothetical protein